MMIKDVKIVKLVGEAENFRLYTGKRGNETVLVKVAKTIDDNQLLAMEAGRANEMKEFNTQLEDFDKKNDRESPAFGLLFAELLYSFTESTQGDRRINVFRINGVEADNLIPLTKVAYQTIIDPRTSVWIIGRFFKLYFFYELMADFLTGLDHPDHEKVNPHYPVFNPDDYFIDIAGHHLIYFGFSPTFEGASANPYIKDITRFMLDWLHEDCDKDTDDYINSVKYIEQLWYFRDHNISTARCAHTELYSLVRELWGIEFYPFTYQNKNAPGSWITLNNKNIKED